MSISCETDSKVQGGGHPWVLLTLCPSPLSGHSPHNARPTHVGSATSGNNAYPNSQHPLSATTGHLGACTVNLPSCCQLPALPALSSILQGNLTSPLNLITQKQQVPAPVHRHGFHSGHCLMCHHCFGNTIDALMHCTLPPPPQCQNLSVMSLSHFSFSAHFSPPLSPVWNLGSVASVHQTLPIPRL